MELKEIGYVVFSIKEGYLNTTGIQHGAYFNLDFPHIPSLTIDMPLDEIQPLWMVALGTQDENNTHASMIYGNPEFPKVFYSGHFLTDLRLATELLARIVRSSALKPTEGDLSSDGN